MQQSAEKSSVSGDSFASLLAALASPATPTAPDRAHALSGDGFEDDVATLSYESALRARARYISAHRPAADSATYDPSDWLLIQSTDPERIHSDKAIANDAPLSARAERPQTAAASSANPRPVPGHTLATPLDHNLKTSSITIRLSSEECAQLRKRAAEAGLTVSAYLRSCTFEAESLRALVKDTLAQLQSASSVKKRPVAAPTRRPRFEWLLRLLPRWPSHQRVAQA